MAKPDVMQKYKSLRLIMGRPTGVVVQEEIDLTPWTDGLRPTEEGFVPGHPVVLIRFNSLGLIMHYDRCPSLIIAMKTTKFDMNPYEVSLFAK